MVSPPAELPNVSSTPVQDDRSFNKDVNAATDEKDAAATPRVTELSDNPAINAVVEHMSGAPLALITTSTPVILVDHQDGSSTVPTQGKRDASGDPFLTPVSGNTDIDAVDKDEGPTPSVTPVADNKPVTEITLECQSQSEPEAPVAADGKTRRSKRLRTVSSRIDGRYQCSKRTKGLIGHPSPPVDSAAEDVAREDRLQRSIEKLKSTRLVSFGGGVSISNKEIFDLLERKKQLGKKVIDALVKFSRFLLRWDDTDGGKLRVDVWNSKFVSQLTRLYPKFSKAENPESFVFPTQLIDSVVGVEDSDRVQLFEEADYVYIPFNFDKKNWVALCVSLTEGNIQIIDCNVQLWSDSQIMSDLQPIAVMLPYLFKQAALNVHMSQIPTAPFSLERVHGIPHVVAPQDYGMMTIFMIHAHAAGGVEECKEFNIDFIESETKKLVSAIMQADIA